MHPFHLLSLARTAVVAFCAACATLNTATKPVELGRAPTALPYMKLTLLARAAPSRPVL